jgi:Protein of unknown function (DUF2933).
MESLLSFLPFALFLLLCPLMMFLMHRRGHGGEQHQHPDDREELASRLQASKDEERS